ncbi:hypothetical protein AMECASPLE_008133 [Ameca splendens]|uniref:Uncharacterized protein n=1 Tax=Ameca splendens TaxID=208324 RepID=A0ABV0XZY5_9TELE
MLKHFKCSLITQQEMSPKVFFPVCICKLPSGFLCDYWRDVGLSARVGAGLVSLWIMTLSSPNILTKYLAFAMRLICTSHTKTRLSLDTDPISFLKYMMAGHSRYVYTST